MRIVAPAIAAALACATAIVPIHAAHVSRTIVTVRIYQMVGLAPVVAGRALDRAADTLEAGLVTVLWRRCSPAPDTEASTACRTPPGRGELALRIVRDRIAAVPDGSTVLGDALVDPHARTGVLATVYHDRVAALAAVAGIDLADLLGRAVAHELGHLLMASTTHASHGLMRSTWTRDELRRDRAADWRFAPDDIAAMQRRPTYD